MLINLFQVPHYSKELQVLREWAVLIQEKAQHTSELQTLLMPSPGHVLGWLNELGSHDQAKGVKQELANCWMSAMLYFSNILLIIWLKNWYIKREGDWQMFLKMWLEKDFRMYAHDGEVLERFQIMYVVYEKTMQTLTKNVDE